MRKLTRYMLVLFSFIIAGCGSVPPTYYYRLDYGIHSVQNSSAVEVPVTIAILTFKSDLLYESEKIIYRDSKYEAKYYHYRKWIAPPKQMIQEKLIKEYQQSGRFKRVHKMPLSTGVDYVLEGRLLAFEEWDEGQSWYGSVAINFALKKTTSDSLLWQKTFKERTPAITREPAEVVISINKSLDKVIQQSIEEVTTFISSQ